MAIDTFAEHGESGSESDDPRLRAQASVALERLLQDHPAIAGEIRAAVRAHIHLRELDRARPSGHRGRARSRSARGYPGGQA